MGVDRFVDSAWLESGLTAIASAIRVKTGGVDLLTFPNGFIDAINSITVGEGGETTSRAAGLYETGTNTLVNSWDELVSSGYVTDIEGVLQKGVEQQQFYELTGDLVLPDGSVAIDNDCFSNCELTCVVLPNTIEFIGEYAFSRCYSLKSIAIPEGVTDIKRNTFSNCKALESIVLPKTLQSVAQQAFFNAAINGLQVYYRGTIAMYQNISIGNYNDPLQNATKTYDYVG